MPSTQNSRWAAMPFALLLLHLVVGAGGLARSGRRPPPPSQKKPSWKPQLLDAEPAPAPPRVLHRDADVVVVDKPPGWSVDAAAAFVADLLGAEPRVRQRLDADCSGVLCLGASAAGDAALRDAAPSYLALVDDEPARAAAARGACSIIESGPAGAVVRVAGRDVRKSLAAGEQGHQFGLPSFPAQFRFSSKFPFRWI